MTLTDKICELKNSYDLIDIVDLDKWYDEPFYKRSIWLQKKVENLYKEYFKNNQRIIFTLTRGDVYENSDSIAGILISDLQKKLNQVDISNFFIILLSNDKQYIPASCDWIQKHISRDTIPLTHIAYADDIKEKKLKEMLKNNHDYNNKFPLKLDVDSLIDHQRHLLLDSKTFCMYPWIHLHAYPTGKAYPCCHSEQEYSVGNCHDNSLKEIWNNAPLRDLRYKMLNDISVEGCNRCYEQEESGFFSGRQSVNKHFGHYIDLISNTQEDGTLDNFQLIYWDIRFSNLCNLSCRSCGHIFSSSWYQDQIKLTGTEWAQKNQALNYAGKHKTDMWEQLLPHLDYVEQIYFAGGEPLMMEEHYNILDELERRGRFDVRLIYNTNFTNIKLKNRTVFDYWKRFKSVAVGASLDDMGPRAEYIRKGTNWDIIERNRMQMLEICPQVDFYVSPTLSILNALHLPKFHQDWTNRGFIRAQDLNINILQDPPHYRIDIAPIKYKQQIQMAYEEHLEWLRPLDELHRATVGFESAIKYMMATDNSELLPKFWNKTYQLDSIRKENILETIPELSALQ